MPRTDIYPFTAIVGQDRMKRALVLNAVNPRIGGVLIRGERGTAKSTAARALNALLPEVSVVVGCRFGCDPGHPESFCDECRTRVADGEDAVAGDLAGEPMALASSVFQVELGIAVVVDPDGTGWNPVGSAKRDEQ